MKFSKGYTHGGTFHADDVFSTILLKRLNPNIEIERVFKVTPDMISEDAIVYDTGLGQFDHHQKDKATRPLEDWTYIDKGGEEKPIPYCSFGLLWKEFGRTLCEDDYAWKKFDREFVLPVDKHDNGIERSTLATTVGSLNPNWDDEDQDFTAAFWHAVDMFTPVFEATLNKINSAARARALVREAYGKMGPSGILELDRYLPWQDTVIEEMADVKFVIFPSNRGGYNTQTVPLTPGNTVGRVMFPKEWLGNPDKSLGMTFCHVGNWLASTETLEQAEAVAMTAIYRSML